MSTDVDFALKPLGQDRSPNAVDTGPPQIPRGELGGPGVLWSQCTQRY